MRDILVLCPQERDLKAIRAAGLEDRYRVHFAGSDLDQLDDFDPEAFLDECEAIPADAVLGHEGPVGAPRRAPGRAARAGRAEPAGARRLPAQADRPRDPAARCAGGDTAVRRHQRRPAVRRPVLRQAGRRTPVAERVPDRGPRRPAGPARDRPLHDALCRDRGAGRRRSGGGARLHGRGAPLGRGGHARGLRPRRPRDDDRCHRLDQVPGAPSASRASSTRALCRASGSRSSRISPRACCRRSGSRAASSTSSSSSPRTVRHRSSRSTGGSPRSSRRSSRPCTDARPTTRSSGWRSARIRRGAPASRTAWR